MVVEHSRRVPMPVDYADRLRRARRIERSYDGFHDLVASGADDEAGDQVMARIDPRAHVGSRHHTVPRFLLDRWATDNQVQVFSRVDRRFSTRNVQDLAVRDFYTFIDVKGEPDSSIESVLQVVEEETAPVIRRLLNPFTPPQRPSETELATLAMFASFQIVRTARHRREMELQADWYAKTMLSGRIEDAQLRAITIVPHQNESVERLGMMSQRLFPYFMQRPLALIRLDRPRLLIGDEPVVINPGAGEVVHHPDCFITDEQMEARFARERRKKAKRRRDVSRVIHMTSTKPTGVGTAEEIVLPISPRSALLWGPIMENPGGATLEQDMLDYAESAEFASQLNNATGLQSLDWVVSRRADTGFVDCEFSEPGPLLHMCDGTNAASLAVNSTPKRMRPHRLKRP